jgi:hypothetical protein
MPSPLPPVFLCQRDQIVFFFLRQLGCTIQVALTGSFFSGCWDFMAELALDAGTEELGAFPRCIRRRRKDKSA